jgi:hypothetical protein
MKYAATGCAWASEITAIWMTIVSAKYTSQISNRVCFFRPRRPRIVLAAVE